MAFYLQGLVLLLIYYAEYWSPSCLHLLKFLFAQWYWASTNIICVFWLWCNCISSMWRHFGNVNLVLSAWSKQAVAKGIGFCLFLCFGFWGFFLCDTECVMYRVTVPIKVLSQITFLWRSTNSIEPVLSELLQNIDGVKQSPPENCKRICRKWDEILHLCSRTALEHNFRTDTVSAGVLSQR